MTMGPGSSPDPNIYYRTKENHALDAWFKKAYGDEQENPVMIIERSANCTIVHNRDSFGKNDTVDYSR